MKNNLHSFKEYYYGFGRGRYSEALDEMRLHGSVHSCQTSSLPLAECWEPDNLKKLEDKLRPFIGEVDLEKACKYFEFPTDPIVDGKCIGNASMTDLMILDGVRQMAIEAKFTEYSRMPDETVGEWLVKADGNRANRRRVARCWLSYIREAGCTDFEDSEHVLESIGDVCYQFLHRTASACCKTDAKNGPEAVLVYQLFYDANDKGSVKDCEAFRAKLRTWAGILRLRNMKFLILSVPIVNAAEVRELYDGCKEDLFEIMKRRTVYRFDIDAALVEELWQEGAATGLYLETNVSDYEISRSLSTIPAAG